MDLSWVNFFLVMLVLHQEFGHSTVEGYCSTRVLTIPNGSYYLRSGNSLARFECDTGFQLYGVEQLVCFGSSWSSDPPMCIANTCSEIVPTAALLVTKEYEGAVLKFTCAAMYKLNGTSKLVCDGTDWSHRQPTCDSWTPPLSCDFEKPDICGWSHHEIGDQEWKRNSGSTPTSRTGPSHDHTYGMDGAGYYMFFETSSPTRTNHKAILMSPLYAETYSKPSKCVKFFYHIHGERDIGTLEVFIKPQSTDLTTLTPSFEVAEASGDVWIEHTISVPHQTEPFQILFVATRGTSYRSDFAIDDVELNDCTDASNKRWLEIIAGSDGSSRYRSFTVLLYTLQPEVTTAPEKPTTVLSTTLRASTVKATTPLPTTKFPPTTTTTTMKTTTPLTTTPPTTTTTPPMKTTSKPDNTTITPVKTTRSIEKTTFKSRKTSDETTKAEMGTESTTLKPVINPDLHHPSSQLTLKEDRHGTSKIVYIIIGVGLVFVTAGLVVVGIIWYRRRQKLRRQPLDSLSSSNPLYRAVNGDEAINFAIDPYQN